MKELIAGSTSDVYLLNEIGTFTSYEAESEVSADVSVCFSGTALDGTKYDDKIIYDEELYYNNKVIKLYDLYDLLHDYMRTYKIVLAQIMISVGNDEDVIFEVVYVEHETVRSLSDLLKTFLLSTNTKMCLGRPSSETIYAVGTETSVSLIKNVTYQKEDGKIGTKSFSETITHTATPWLQSIKLDFDSMEQDIGEEIEENNITLLMVAVVMGSRSVTYYFDNEGFYSQHKCFVFYNDFNVLESIYMKGVQTAVTEMTRSVVKDSHKNKWYGMEVERSFKFNSAAMFSYQKEEYEAFVNSPSFFVLIGTALKEALLTDETCEMNDDISQVNNAEIEFELVDTLDPGILVTSESRIFAQTFDYVYG